MRNVDIEVKGEHVIVRMKIDKATREASPKSKSGKSQVLASTHGFCAVPLGNGTSGKLGINLIVEE